MGKKQNIYLKTCLVGKNIPLLYWGDLGVGALKEEKVHVENQ